VASGQRDAVMMSRRGGTVVLTSVERADQEVTLPQVTVAVQSRAILSAQNGHVRMRHHLPIYIRMMEDGLLRPEEIVTRRYTLDEIDEASYDVGSGYVVVDTGPWIFGHKVMLPAGVIDRVDFDEENVYVNRTKDEIKNAPEFDPDQYRDDAYRGRLGSYYGPGGAGW